MKEIKIKTLENVPFLFAEDASASKLYMYRPWFFPEFASCCVTEAQYGVFQTIVRLTASGGITTAQAKIAEALFVARGWVWADDAERDRTERERQVEYFESLLEIIGR